MQRYKNGPAFRYRPDLDSLEERRLLSGGIGPEPLPVYSGLFHDLSVNGPNRTPDSQGPLADGWSQPPFSISPAASRIELQHEFGWESNPPPMPLRLFPIADPSGSFPAIALGFDSLAHSAGALPASTSEPASLLIGWAEMSQRDLLHSPLDQTAWSFIMEAIHRGRFSEASAHDPSGPPPISSQNESLVSLPGNLDRPAKSQLTSAGESQPAAAGPTTVQRTQALSTIPVVSNVIPLMEPPAVRPEVFTQSLSGGVTPELAAELGEGVPEAEGSTQPVLTQHVAGDLPARGLVSQALLAGIAVLRGASPDELPLPEDAGLIAEASPFDRAALERAIDQFVERLDDLGMRGIGQQASPELIPVSLTVIAAAAALHVVRRRLHHRMNERRAVFGLAPVENESLLGFPELPGSLSKRPS
jgi:hypothetical protein